MAAMKVDQVFPAVNEESESANAASSWSLTNVSGRCFPFPTAGTCRRWNRPGRPYSCDLKHRRVKSAQPLNNGSEPGARLAVAWYHNCGAEDPVAGSLVYLVIPKLPF